MIEGVMPATGKTVLMFLPKWNKDAQDAFSGARAAAFALNWNFLSADRAFAIAAGASADARAWEEPRER